MTVQVRNFIFQMPNDPTDRVPGNAGLITSGDEAVTEGIEIDDPDLVVSDPQAGKQLPEI